MLFASIRFICIYFASVIIINVILFMHDYNQCYRMYMHIVKVLVYALNF